MAQQPRSSGSSANVKPNTTGTVIVTPTGPVSNNPTDRKFHDLETKEAKISTKRKPTSEWMKTLYDPNLINEEDLAGIYDSVRFIGFNRETVLAELEEKVNDMKIVIELVIGCALRGPVAMSQVKMSNGKTPVQMGIPASGQQGTEHVSCQRITAATADLAAFYLKKLNVSKRLLLDCPGWLQFPSAGAIKMPEALRLQHLEFARRFSPVIGGVFNEQIYTQMIANSYLDEKLKLFEPP